MSLEQAKKRGDINRIVQISADLERFKTLCGYSESLRQFEASMERTAKELGIESMPEISRALTTQQPNVDKLFIMRGFELIQINPDGTTCYPEPKAEPEKPQFPYQVPRRNCDIKREAGEK